MRSIILYLLLCSPCWAQIELSARSQISYVGITDPIIVGDRILAGPDSRATPVEVFIISLKKAIPNLSMFAVHSSLVSVDLVLVKGSEVDYMLVGSGEYLVNAAANGVRAELRVTLGLGPRPPPIPPDPPGPIPPPTPPPGPTPDIPNEFNLGRLAYSAAPADAPTAKLVAGMYRTGAGKLFGQVGQLSDIASIIREVDAKFDLKQCRDVATCEKWNEWKVKVNAASKAEQIRRGTFTRQHWFAALSEIAIALEAVK